MNKLIGATVVFAVIAFIVLIAAYVVVVNLMVQRLGISTWEAVALLFVAHAIFGSGPSTSWKFRK